MSDKKKAKFPERPGKTICSYYQITGNCHLKKKCKLHHPKDMKPVEPNLAYNDKGLPLRPNQATCPNYSRFGLCKSGLACKFDHSNEASSSGHK
ncbi:hypothetical protein CARUB_v10011282mg [Capsella rubella]|uniref:C3H1-type domain-containing protein n=1 Tax=Capsella rubella TaxID=81985 RepID=R0IK69_9BRAS|nr:hypothetical protein CARUB_v10011282mg [Capsella rubella]